jgi:ferredoxin-type protein NapG
VSGAIQPGVDGTPYLNGLSGWCDFCMCCTDVCPTNALQPFEPETVKMGTAVIDINRCIAWDHIGCRLCHEKCIDLQDAIWIDEKFRPHIDEDKCNGCNGCVYVCPQSAVRGRNKKYGKAVVVIP